METTQFLVIVTETHFLLEIYRVFESFEDNAAREKQLALACQTAQSRNLVLISIEIPLLEKGDFRMHT